MGLLKDRKKGVKKRNSALVASKCGCLTHLLYDNENSNWEAVVVLVVLERKERDVPANFEF